MQNEIHCKNQVPSEAINSIGYNLRHDFLTRTWISSCNNHDLYTGENVLRYRDISEMICIIAHISYPGLIKI